MTAVESFVNRENINKIFEQNGFTGEIGLLSIDIDGVDYWVWESIMVIDPIIVVVEYNALFGMKRWWSGVFSGFFRCGGGCSGSDG